MKRRTWRVTETATYIDGTKVTVRRRTVEEGLSRRSARRAVSEWQSASNRNKLLLLTLTNVAYSIAPGGGQ